MQKQKYLTASVLGVLLVGLLQAQMGGLIGQYMAIFYTDTLGMPAQWVGTLLFVVIMWDALNDPIEGVITDNIPFHPKHGKYRRVGLWANIFLAITSVLIFWVPSHFSLLQKTIYAYAINILWRVAYSFVPVLPLTANISANPVTRTRINSVQRLLILGVGLLTSYTFFFVEYFGKGEASRGYRYMILLFVLPLFILSFLGNLLIKEQPCSNNASSHNHRFRYADFGHLLRQNKPFRIFLLFSILSSMISPFMFSGFIYYIKYNFGELAMIPLFTISMAGFALGVFFSSLLAKLIERKALLSWCYLALTLTFILFFFLGKQHLYLTYSLYGFINIFLGLTFINTSTLNMEIMDYHEVHFGVRPAAMISAFVQFIGKAQYAIAGYVVLQTLSLVGFQANQEMSVAVFRGLIWVTFMIPALFSLASAFVVQLYPISQQDILNIHQQLQKSANLATMTSK